jgi:ABC-2 type transport system permease protein
VPIHDQGYRRYTSERLPLGQAWFVIAKTGVRTLARRRVFLGLLLVSWFPFFVRAVQIYMATTVPQAAFLAPTPQTFRGFLALQEMFLFLVAVYAGAGSIANDRRANALQIYLSKPITRAEYVFGKLAILLVYLLLVTWVPAVLLLVVQIALSGSFSFFLAHPGLLPAITIFSVVQAVTIGCVMLALSSLSNNSRYVGILYAALLFFTQAIYGVIYAFTRDSRVGLISFTQNLNQVGDAIFRLSPSYPVPPALSAVVLIAIVVASLVTLERRVRAVEIVA